MNILIVSQYFWPEGFRINDLAAELQARGNTVTVLTGVPNYPSGRIDRRYQARPSDFASYRGVDIVRVPIFPRGRKRLSLMLNYLSFVVSGSTLGIARLWRRKFDVIFVWQVSPVTLAIPGILLRRVKRLPLAMWVLDLWPDSLRAVGATKSPAVLGLVGGFVSLIYDHCDLIFGQSRRLTEEISQRAGPSKDVRYLPSWAEPAPLAQAAAPEIGADRRFTIMFAGNIGEAQDFPAILEAASILRGEAVRWLIVGDGRKMEWLRGEVERLQLGDTVQLVGRFPPERMPSFFEHADALLVTLKTDPVLAMTVPGKVQSYLAAGRPILAMLDGEGARVVVESGGGIAVPSGDAAGLAGAVKQMSDLSVTERNLMAENGRRYCAQEFDRDTVISGLERELIGLAGRGYKRSGGSRER